MNPTGAELFGRERELALITALVNNDGGAVQLLQSKQVTTSGGAGSVSFSVTLAGLSPGQALTATATSTIAGNSSEFSANRTVTTGP